LIDSSGYLEIAANQASAAKLTGCAPGDPITVHLAQK
jgi:S-adenosyl-L-methionine hydrolase (adenosine-forming)